MRHRLKFLKNKILAMPWRVIEKFQRTRACNNVNFVAEDADWAIRWVGEGIKNGLNNESAGQFSLTTIAHRLNSSVIHFGSQYMWVDWEPHISRTNKAVVSFFHGKPEDGKDSAKHIDQFLYSLPRLERIVASSEIMLRRLDSWGVPKKRSLIC